MLAGTLLTEADRLAQIAVQQAEAAFEFGTFGVGGVLIDKNGNVLTTMQNRVIVENYVHDYTAHVERQIVEWYFTQLKQGAKLPPPAELTIICSLDPCLMCTGAILSAGFNVIHISKDTEAGIDYDSSGKYLPVPQILRRTALKTFAAFGLKGKREFVGNKDSIFYNQSIDASYEVRTSNAFWNSTKKTRRIIFAPERDSINDLNDPKSLDKDDELIQKLKGYYPDALETVSLEDEKKLCPLLLDLARKSEKEGSPFNSAILLDPFDNVLMASKSNERESPICTPFMGLLQNYAKFLHEIKDKDQSYFAHPKFCRFISLVGPSEDAKSLMNLGAFGSALEDRLPKESKDMFQWVVPGIDDECLQDMINHFPPMYNKIIRIQNGMRQISNKEAIKICTEEFKTREKLKD